MNSKDERKINNTSRKKRRVLKHPCKNEKTSLGSGLKQTFKNIVLRTKKHIKNLKPKCKKALIDLAHEVAQELTPDLPIKLPRIIPIPKTGGFLPLVPIFASLSAAGNLAGGAVGIAEAINAFKIAKKKLREIKTHNRNTEAVCIGKGLHLNSYKDGLGIYVTKTKN